MKRGSSLYTYYITVVYRDAVEAVSKVNASCERIALAKVMRTISRDDVARTYIGEPIPVARHKKQQALARKQGQRARRKREREERIMVTNGVRSLGNLHEYNKAKEESSED